MDAVAAQTIRDFGQQWTRYRDNEGFYGSTELLADILGPLLPLSAFRGARIADIGSGTGRIVHMLLDAGAAHVTAIEPSDAFDALEENTRCGGDRVRRIHALGECVGEFRDLDYVVSIGVIHHVPDPKPILAAAHRALRPGGRCLIWLYGHEGNEAYLRWVQPLRRVTAHLPHVPLAALAWLLTAALQAYGGLCRVLKLPLADYVVNVLGRMPLRKQQLVVYDQLNPAYAKYYRRAEALALLEHVGFGDVQAYHRRGYSWTVIGTKSMDDRVNS